MKTFDVDLNGSSFQTNNFSPDSYVLDEELSGALEVAIALNQPLLLTGEPGTGKTRLAWKIAWDLSQKYPNFLSEPLVYHTKTTAKSQDLFYHYDAMRHFHDANIQKAAGKEAPPTSDYVDLRALGKAIALTHEQEVVDGTFIQATQACSSVVLIDEIDKAPRDFPNDILNEIENSEFEIKEAGNHLIKKGEGQRIIVIMTSNSEKNLPEAFLRRCVFYHIPFPSHKQLLEIVNSQLGNKNGYSHDRLIRHFERIRAVVKKKKPATAELIAWLRILEIQGLLSDNLPLSKLDPKQKKLLKLSYSVLAKHKEDLQAIEEAML